MQSLVDSLAQQRKRHLEVIENTTIKDLKEMVTTNNKYPVEKDQLRSAVAHQGGTQERGRVQKVLDGW